MSSLKLHDHDVWTSDDVGDRMMYVSVLLHQVLGRSGLATGVVTSGEINCIAWAQHGTTEPEIYLPKLWLFKGSDRGQI